MSIKQTTLFDDEPVKAEHTKDSIKAPFPYFGGKSGVASLIWYAFGEVKQYIEPFCGSAAVLLGNPKPASLEVAGDVNCYIANFWRAVKYQPDAVAEQADYPVSHIDLAARHRWLVEPERTADLAANLADPEWPGDAQVAGWWCWGQCAWIGSGWCDSGGQSAKIPHVGDAGRGVQSGSIRRPFRSRDAVRGGRAMERSLSSETPAGDCSGADSPRRGRWARNSERERERERENTGTASLVGRAGDQPWGFL
ncbi:DNA adenine methylase [Hyphomicrobium sp.]|uniref:DNA adenine methylase n=1 Tax=Hyphomicrobium sp. TaxID=82 RepID=UPI0039C8A7FA